MERGGTRWNSILETFSFLEEQYSYTHASKEKADNTFIEFLEINYTNEVRHRKITVIYTKVKAYDEIGFTFSVTITRIPYSSIADFFSLSNYLQSNGEDFSTTMVNDFNVQEAKRILKKLALSIKENALEIIEGNLWLDAYYTRKD